MTDEWPELLEFLFATKKLFAFASLNLQSGSQIYFSEYDCYDSDEAQVAAASVVEPHSVLTFLNTDTGTEISSFR